MKHDDYFLKYTPVIKLALTSTETFSSRPTPSDKEFSERVVSLLREIEKTNSLKTAASNLHLGYTAAWELVHKTEHLMGVKLLNTSTRGGSRLTPEAVELISLYTDLEEYLVIQMMAWWRKKLGSSSK